MWCISAAREVKGSTLNNAHIFYIGHGDQSVFFKFENIINVRVISFRFTWIPMLWVHGHYVYFYFYGAGGVDFRRQNLTSTDVRFWGLKSITALLGLNQAVELEGLDQTGWTVLIFLPLVSVHPDHRAFIRRSKGTMLAHAHMPHSALPVTGQTSARAQAELWQSPFCSRFANVPLSKLKYGKVTMWKKLLICKKCYGM